MRARDRRPRAVGCAVRRSGRAAGAILAERCDRPRGRGARADRIRDLLVADLRDLGPARSRPAVRHRAAGDDRRDHAAGTSLFLDLTDKVMTAASEVWSMAFAPDFAQSGLFYVAYAANGRRADARRVPRGGRRPATEATRRGARARLAGEHQPQRRPAAVRPDGYLYWSRRGRVAATASRQSLGKLLRIAPDGGGATRPPTIRLSRCAGRSGRGCATRGASRSIARPCGGVDDR